MILKLKNSIKLEGSKELYDKLSIEFNMGSKSFSFITKGSQLITFASREHSLDFMDLVAKMSAEDVEKQIEREKNMEKSDKKKSMKAQIKDFINFHNCDDILDMVEDKEGPGLKETFNILKQSNKNFEKFNSMVESELEFQSHSKIRLVGAREDFGKEAIEQLSIYDRLQINKVFFTFFMCI